MAPKIKNKTHVELNDGRLMPLVGLGCWQASIGEISDSVETALNADYRLIDTAYTYLNEEGVGQGIKRWGGKREDIFVVTKLPLTGMGGGKVEHFLKLSLAKMGLDYVDLYLIHVPVGLKYYDDKNIYPADAAGNLELDYSSDHLALWKEMEAVRAAGLARSIGVSNFSTNQLRRLMQAAKVPPAVSQVELHVQFQQPEMKKYCDEVGIVITSYGSLGSPGRSGTTLEEGCYMPSLLEHPVVGVVATLHKVTPGQVLLRFLVQQGIVVIPKSVNKNRIQTNFDVQNWSLSDQAMEALRTLELGERGRSFNFLYRLGLQYHPDCPVSAPIHKIENI